MATIFTKIIRGEIPCYKIAEDENYFAFLDISPLEKGHTLVVPKKESDYIFGMPDDELCGLMIFSKKIALAIEKAVPCKRIGIAVIGLEVLHTHIHLIPLLEVATLNFARPKKKLEPTELQEIADKIKENL